MDPRSQPQPQNTGAQQVPPTAQSSQVYQQYAPQPPTMPAPGMHEPAAYRAPAAPYSQPQATEVYTASSAPVVTWTASEFIAHHKTSAWYLALAAGGFVGSLLVYLITRDVVSAGVVVIGAILFGVMAGRQPRQLQYAVYDQGLTIGAKAYPYKDFRSFSVVDEGHFSSIVFMPLKRFSPPLNIYYHPDDEHKIVEVLALHLPLQPYTRDLTDKLMRQIRF